MNSSSFSPTPRLTTLYDTSTSLLSQTWSNLYTTYQLTPGLLEFYILITIQLLFFWLPCTLLVLLDIFFPAFSQRHKIQPLNRQPSWTQIKHCISYVAENNITGSLVHWGVIYLLGGGRWSIFRVERELPAWREVAGDFLVALVAREMMFYYSHRILHWPAIYRKIHKKHHSFPAPISFAAQYAHPIEHLVSNTLPIILPLSTPLRRAHILSFALYFSYALLETTAAHSGYDFFRPPFEADMHDQHHEEFGVNFGAMSLWGWGLDWIHGTDGGEGRKGGKKGGRVEDEDEDQNEDEDRKIENVANVGKVRDADERREGIIKKTEISEGRRVLRERKVKGGEEKQRRKGD